MTPLYQAGSLSRDSAAFTICPGEAVVLFASGFKAKRVRASASEMDGPQLACLRRLVFDCAPGEIVALEPASYCDYVYEQGAMTKSVACDEGVRVGGNAVALSMCNNIIVFALPGSYYFRLNDETAVGEAQVWVEKYKVSDLPEALFTQYSGECHG